MRFLAVVAGALAFCASAFAEEPAFVTSRPEQTESPIAVPKGYLQIETEFGSYSRAKSVGVTSTTAQIASTDFRYGIAEGVDVELIVSPYVRAYESGAGPSDTLDAGVNLGVTDAADDGNVFVGWSHRF